MQKTILSDVSRVTLLRERMGRAASSIKVIGVVSAILVIVYGSIVYEFITPWVTIPLGILMLWFAFRFSNNLRLGEASGIRLIILWVVVFLIIVLLDLPCSLSGELTFTLALGLIIMYLPIYYFIRGLRELRAYKSVLTSNPSEFEPLTLHPWEDKGRGVRKHPKLLNKSSLMAYIFILLVPLLWLLMKIATSQGEGPKSDDAGYLIGWNISQIAIGLVFFVWMAKLYRRGRRHAMLPGNKLIKKDNRDIVLYLQAFLDDSTIKMWARANDGRIFLERFVKISFEELVTDHL